MSKRAIQPIYRRVMREFVNELIHHSIDSHSSTNELEFGIFRVLKDEVISVESG